MSRLGWVLRPAKWSGDALQYRFGRCSAPANVAQCGLQMMKFGRFGGPGLLRVNYARTRRGFVPILWNCAKQLQPPASCVANHAGAGGCRLTTPVVSLLQEVRRRCC